MGAGVARLKVAGTVGRPQLARIAKVEVDTTQGGSGIFGIEAGIEFQICPAAIPTHHAESVISYRTGAGKYVGTAARYPQGLMDLA